MGNSHARAALPVNSGVRTVMRTIVAELWQFVLTTPDREVWVPRLELHGKKKEIGCDHRGMSASGHIYPLSGANCPFLSRECT
jgi:hypothetical protein